MEKLPDLALQALFLKLSLNDRANLRLMNTRFKTFCDSIKITKLVIYERNWPRLPGILEHTGEAYDIADTANVTDLNSFFANPVLLEQMKQIKILVIYGEKQTAVQLTHPFDDLTHLELHDLEFTDLAILSSPNLQTLVLNRVSHIWNTMTTSQEAIRRIEQREQKPMSILLSGLNYVTSRHIKHFRTDREFNPTFLQYCLEKGIFDSIERLGIAPVGNLNHLVFFLRHYPTLKQIELNQQAAYLSKILNNSNLEWAARKLIEKNGSLLVFGLLYCSESLNEIKNALENFVCTGWHQVMDGEVYESLTRSNHYLELERYGRFVDELAKDMYQPATETYFFKLLGQCKGIRLGFSKHLDECEKRFLRGFSGLKKITIDFPFSFDGYPQIIEFLQLHEHLEVLDIDLWRKPSQLDFIFNLKRLKELQLRSFSIEPSFFADLVQTLKHLKKANLLFLKDSSNSPEFKKLINESVAHRGVQFNIKYFGGSTSPTFQYQLTDGDFKDPTYNHLSQMRGWLREVELS